MTSILELNDLELTLHKGTEGPLSIAGHGDCAQR